MGDLRREGGSNGVWTAINDKISYKTVSAFFAITSIFFLTGMIAALNTWSEVRNIPKDREKAEKREERIIKNEKDILTICTRMEMYEKIQEKLAENTDRIANQLERINRRP